MTFIIKLSQPVFYSSVIWFMLQFTNLTELIKAFPDDESARVYLENQRWADGVFCPFCGNTEKIYTINNGRRRMCGEIRCAKQFSVTVGTIFENTKLPLNKWFAAIYLMTAHRKGISSLQLSRDIGVTQKTAWFMLHRIREMVSVRESQVQMSGVIEVDESYIGGKEKNKHKRKRIKEKKQTGRSASKTPVLGILQRGGQVFAKKVISADHAHILPEIDKRVEKGSTIMTDNWPAYQKLDLDYAHYVIDHSNGYYGRGQIHTNTIEGFWSLLKRGVIGIYHFVSYRHLNKYCAEYAYRYNTNKISDPERFKKALPMGEGKRLKYKDLTAKWIVGG